MFSLDYSVFNAIYGFATSVSYLEWVYVFLANYFPYIIAIVFLYELLHVKDLKKKFYIFFLTIVSVLFSWGIIAYSFHFFFYRARPFIALGAVSGTSTPAVVSLIHAAASPSFPSGHIAFLTPIVLAAFLINKRTGIWLSVLTIFVGIGRVAVGVHWPSDILGGMLSGVISYFAIYLLFSKTTKLKA